MLAVCNTSPISNLASIGRLNLLQSQFETILIPRAVADELAAHPDPAARALIQAAFDAGLIQICGVNDSPVLRMLHAQLHAGEAEAIALALESHADKVLIDEKEGRRIALQSGLSVTGVLGILLAAKEKGQIEEIRPELAKLHLLAGFFVAPALAARVLAAANEE
jgi:predicted nucleic acid-binding protein